MDIRTYYESLQIDEAASPETVRRAYRELTQKWHPDKNLEHRDAAEKITRLINEAYEVLSDPAQRAAHDAWIRQQRGQVRGDDGKRATASEPPWRPQPAHQDDVHHRPMRPDWPIGLVSGAILGALVFLLVSIGMRSAIAPSAETFLLFLIAGIIVGALTLRR